MASYTSTKDGKVEAPSWYKNADGSTPSTMQKGLTKEKWESQNASIQQKKEAEANKVQAKEKASAYLKNHSNAGQGSNRDAGFQEILKEGGLNNSEFQNMSQAENKTKAEQNKADRKQEARAYQQYTTDKNDARKASGGSMARAVDQSQYYKHQMETNGSYGGRPEQQESIKRLMGTGQQFTTVDIQREMGSASFNNNKGLYQKYGGIDNYFDNYSVGSGNFQSQEGIGTSKEADDQQRAFLDSRSGFFNSNDFDKKYGKYDFAKQDKERFNQYQTDFTQQLDDREFKLTGTDRGASMGY